MDGKFIGVELEIESGTGDWTDILDALPAHDDTTDGPGPDLEEDGTLDEDAGIEIIFPPYSPREIRNPNNYLNRCIRAIEANAHVHIHGECGMHMNVNSKGWSNSKKAVFMAVIHNTPQKVLEDLGGRRLNHWCRQIRASEISKWSWDSTKPAMRMYVSSPDSCHDYAAEHTGRNRIECRFPGATTDINHLVRLTYFFEYLEDFAEQYVLDWEEDPAELWDHFLEWLETHRNASAKKLRSSFP